MSPSKPIILASSSEHRKQLLLQIGLSFTCKKPQINEKREPHEEIQQMVERLSFKKASAIQKHHPNSIIIGSDQSAELNGALLNKPYTSEVAFEQLSRCSGQMVTFITGLCILAPDSYQKTCLVKTEVEFRELSSAQIYAYIQRESPLTCAGSFKCEGLGITLFKAIRSDDPTALVGLPLISLNQYLLELGVDALCDQKT